MAYRKDGTTLTPYCFQCHKPLWNMKRARKHCKKYQHTIWRNEIKRGQFPKIGANSGEKNGRHKLTYFSAAAIRHHYGRGASTYELAKFWKVSQNCIWLCVTGKTWNSTGNGSNLHVSCFSIV